jgi:hypothetical protein
MHELPNPDPQQLDFQNRESRVTRRKE